MSLDSLSESDRTDVDDRGGGAPRCPAAKRFGVAAGQSPGSAGFDDASSRHPANTSETQGNHRARALPRPTSSMGRLQNPASSFGVFVDGIDNETNVHKR